MGKGTTILLNQRGSFSKRYNNLTINSITGVMKHINIRSKQIGTEKNCNCKFINVQVLNLLLLFPFFAVRNVLRYSSSALGRMFVCEKDMFCRFMNDGNIKWRQLLYGLNTQLRRKISSETGTNHEKPVCLIIDDMDAPKTGKKTELMGRILSHTQHKSIFGDKCLTLLPSYGLSRMVLDFSIHGEEGMGWLTKAEHDASFSEGYSGQVVEERIKEYFMKKTDKAIEMVRYAIKRGIRFDYLLIDSRFTDTAFVRLITSHHTNATSWA